MKVSITLNQNKVSVRSLITFIFLCLLNYNLTADTLIHPSKYKSPLAALTFDDGPKPEFAIPLLNLLDQHHVRATFFVVGKEALTHPDIIYRMHQSGHELGNHSYSHHRMDSLSKDKVYEEIERTNKVLEKISNQKINFFRPPGGRLNKTVRSAVKDHNLEIAFWDINPGDYTFFTQGLSIKGDRIKNLARHISEKVLTNIKSGDIILLHNGGPETLESLPTIINRLRQKGYKFVTLTELNKINNGQFNFQKN